MTKELKEWLYTPCEISELVELKEGVYYLPIGAVKKKIEYMEEKFGVTVLETNFHHFLFNTNQRETVASGSIGITMMQNVTFRKDGSDGVSRLYEKQLGIIAQLIGAATFPLAYYGENTHYAATLESLCIVNAFGGKYPQFGSALNKFDVVVDDKKLAKVPEAEVDKEMQKLFKQVKTKLSKFSYREDAHAYLDSTTFKLNIELKNIVQNLKPKN